MNGTSAEPLTGERIRALREAADLSQADLARLSGLTRNTVHAAESGRRISWKSRRKLQAVFDDLSTPLSAIDQVRAELAELRNQVAALADGRAA